MLALLDRLRIGACKGLGVSGGGNVLLHMELSVEMTKADGGCVLER